MNKLLNIAKDIAFSAHKDQTDKAGKPYIEHIVRVAASCQREDEKIVALLHDTIEDTAITADSLNNQFPLYIIEAVLSVTRKSEESYSDFILRARDNQIGRIVKINDLLDNMNLSRLNEITPKDLDRLSKYITALRVLVI